MGANSRAEGLQLCQTREPRGKKKNTDSDSALQFQNFLELLN